MTIPHINDLKRQAKLLRQSLDERGVPITHSRALETLAHQYGMHDWNTLCAASSHDAPPIWHIGQNVQGEYLGQKFTGKLKALRDLGGRNWALTVVFDAAVDVATSEHITNLRKQVNCTLNAHGTTTARTSNGKPQMMLKAV